jgi:hypothetical protein
VVELDSPPEPVVQLLRERWLGEIGPAGPRAQRTGFLLRWCIRPSVEGSLGLHWAGAPPQVRWRATEGGGSFVGPGGRVLWPGDPGQAIVELEAGSTRRPELLEPLVEAALTLALAHLGCCFLHAAAMEIGDRRLLVLGASGSGKSTLAAAAVACGGRVVSDDSVLLSAHRGQPLVRTACSDVWLRPGAPRLLAALRQRGFEAERPREGRYRLRRRLARAAFRTHFTPDGMILLRRDLRRATFRLEPRSQAEALAALASGTSALYLSARARAPALLALMADCVERLPTCELRVGRWLVEAPNRCLPAIEERLAALRDA